ncbi:putative membrane protein [Salegentibacter sp. 24]|jgi:uncharacterized membrane protein|uniref:DUF2231 domain-containing protein n=1 Tax=Salegentibacter sp. 24 TaxID=2183986 RepID=UPI001061D896|nr:DUF2231 domain-containing protein [Salegentibacter sp. 24]TDN87264.1 putative membrane protein [Salegentibacter sp. 24]
MDQLPDFWRTEVFHPLSVHFPIALLLVAFLFKLVALGYPKEVWKQGGTILLVLGTIGIWIAIYTGNLADGIVSRKICDPTVLKDHQNMAYVTAWLYTASLLLDLLKFSKLRIFKTKVKFLSYICILTLAIGSGYLMYVGHLGARLVYQQGAGVYHPSQDCIEFN